MKEIVKKYIVYVVLILISLYALPLFIQDTGSAMSVLLMYIPASVFLVSIVFGLKNEFPYVLPALVALLFIPTIFIYYNSSAMVYIFGFYFVSLIGVALGQLIRKLRAR